MPVNFPVKADEDANDLTAPYNELETFDSIWDALRWKHLQKRVPICFKKTLYNRYMIANLVYLGYTIALLVIDFYPGFNSNSSDISITMEESNYTISILDQPVIMNEYVNRLYIAWRGRSWFDVVLIPEYLNHIQAGLYLWSSLWYSKQTTLGGYYTMAVHRIELAASCTEICAAIGWMLSWYMTYTRTIGRGFTFDDPDTMGYLTTTSNTLMYLVYNIQLNIYPEQYGTNQIYVYADVLGFIGSVYYILGTLRDENWFWFLPLAGQYGIAAGRIHIETRVLPQFGRHEILITNLCRRRKEKIKDNKENENNMNMDIITEYF
ncbi:unnamed protein product [Rotaria sordida]|uniref:Uncharacterized protein n=1 Tax=Rotaria sordida TaxID=392033 RepID=A0A813X752_9BILA|nr:unnamed protein product [Rotaria sordida]